MKSFPFIKLYQTQAHHHHRAAALCLFTSFSSLWRYDDDAAAANITRDPTLLDAGAAVVFSFTASGGFLALTAEEAPLQTSATSR